MFIFYDIKPLQTCNLNQDPGKNHPKVGFDLHGLQPVMLYSHTKDISWPELHLKDNLYHRLDQNSLNVQDLKLASEYTIRYTRWPARPTFSVEKWHFSVTLRQGARSRALQLRL
jgi:hypothetical protein